MKITENKSLQTQVQLDLESSKSIIARIELNQMLSLPFLSQLPTPGETMHFCRTIRNRRRQRLGLPAPSVSQLEMWSQEQNCSFLFTESFSSQTSKDFPVSLVEAIQEVDLPTIWALRFEDYWTKPLTCVDLLKMLVLHALQVNLGALTTAPYPITVAALRDAAEEKDWLVILNRALYGVSILYIILDAEVLDQMTRHRPYIATRLLELFPRILSSTIIKIVVSAAVIDESYVRRNWDQDRWTKIMISNLMGKRKLEMRRSAPIQQRIKRRRRQ